MAVKPSLASRLLLVFPLFAVIFLTVWLNNHVIENSYKHEEKFSSVELRYTPKREDNPSLYFVRQNNDQFLFAASTPEKSKPQLFFTSSANLTLTVKPQYNKLNCGNGGINKTRLTLTGDTFFENVILTDNKEYVFPISVSKGQVIDVKITNNSNENCGKAVIAFNKTNNSNYASASFLLIWLCVFLVCLSIQASTLIALLGASFNAVLIYTEASIGLINFSNISFSISLSLSFAGILILFSAIPIRSKILMIFLALNVTCLFLLVSMPAAYQFFFSSPMDSAAIHALLQTYLSQALEFWNQFVGFNNTVLACITFISIFVICWRIHFFKPKKIIAMLVGSLLVISSTIFVTSHLDDSKVFNLFNQSIRTYLYEVANFRAVSETRSQFNLNVKRDAAFAKNTSVFVIGESVNKTHMSAYGYVRKTTPLIDRRIKNGNVIRFSNVFANHTHSNPTISYLLTQANQYNGIKWAESPSILNITNELSIHSSWYTNHRLLGRWSNYITSIAQDATTLRTINNKIGINGQSSTKDGDLLPIWRNSIANTPEQVSFLHFYNSHLSYCNRFPESAITFSNQITRHEYGPWANNRPMSDSLLNCYDNSIVYTDQLLEKIITELDKGDRPSILVYIPDHADDVLQAEFHNSSRFTYDMTTIPLFIWANTQWRQQHPNLWSNLINNKDKAFTNDFFFESVAGLLGIKADIIDPSYDFSSGKFSPPEKLTTLHGRKSLIDENNWHYWQNKNAQSLKNRGIKLGATNIDSVAKAKLALELGVEKFAVHATYSDKGDIQVIDNNLNQVGITLNDLLKVTQGSKLTSVEVAIDEKHDHDVENDLRQLSNENSLNIKHKNNNKEVPSLALVNLLETDAIALHDKSTTLMLNIMTPYDLTEKNIQRLKHLKIYNPNHAIR